MRNMPEIFSPAVVFENMLSDTMGFFLWGPYKIVPYKKNIHCENLIIVENTGNRNPRRYDPLSEGLEIIRDIDILDIQDNEAILSFCDKYGVFEAGPIELDDDNSDEYDGIFGQLGVRGQSLESFKHTAEKIKDLIHLLELTSREYKYDRAKFVSATDLINMLLSGVELQVKADTGTFEQVHYYSSLKQAIGIYLYQRMVTRNMKQRYDIKILKRCKKCNEILEQQRSTKKFCNDTCRSNGRKLK